MCLECLSHPIKVDTGIIPIKDIRETNTRNDEDSCCVEEDKQ